MQETFSAIEIDDSIMVSKKKRADKAHGKKMLKLFKHADGPEDLGPPTGARAGRRLSPPIDQSGSGPPVDLTDPIGPSIDPSTRFG